MKFLFTAILSFAMGVMITPTMAQDNYSTKNKKAIKKYELGIFALNSKDFEVGEAYLREALKEDSLFVEANAALGYLMLDTDRDEEALHYLNRTVGIDPGFNPSMFCTIGHLEFKQGYLELAAKSYRRCLSFQNVSARNKYRAKVGLANCEFVPRAMQSPVDFAPTNLGPNINSKHDEYFPCLTADDATILYTRQLPTDRNMLGYNEDFVMSRLRAGEWIPSYNIGPPINTLNNEGAPTLSADGQLLIFTACPLYGDYGPERHGFGSCDLFFSQKVGDNWTKPQNLGQPVNSKKWESQPSFSADGKTLYFVRGTYSNGGMKEQDIYSSTLTGDGWTKPVKLNSNVNTPGREESVFIHPDGQTLYFSSNGHPGMGGLDLYVSHKDENGEWGKALNIGYPVNTSGDENSLLVNAAGDLAYFASDRDGGQGGLDLYSFKLPSEVKPGKVTYMKGKVFDQSNKRPLQARFELIDLESGDVVVESYSNRGNGEFLVALPVNRDYALNASKNGYLFFSENFTFSDKEGTSEPFHKDVPMHPIKVGEKTVLKNIFFETAKYDLKPASRAELNKLVAFIKSNEKIKVEIGGHTDNVGSKASNQVLSENRARSVYNYLVEHGIEPIRLTYKGYADNEPVATNETAEGRQQNRRTEFKITGIE